MPLTETIRIMLVKRSNMSESELARRIGVSPQNMYSKLKRDNFTEQELLQICEALNCTLNIEFIDNETGEKL